MIAEFEADLARARTREDMAVARAKGRLRGKPPKLSTRQEAHLVELYRAGAHTIGELTELFPITRSTIYRAVVRAGRMHPNLRGAGAGACEGRGRGARIVTDELLVARNPDPDSRLGYLPRLPLSGGMVFRASGAWPAHEGAVLLPGPGRRVARPARHRRSRSDPVPPAPRCGDRRGPGPGSGEPLPAGVHHRPWPGRGVLAVPAHPQAGPAQRHHPDRPRRRDRRAADPLAHHAHSLHRDPPHSSRNGPTATSPAPMPAPAPSTPSPSGSVPTRSRRRRPRLPARQSRPPARSAPGLAPTGSPCPTAADSASTSGKPGETPTNPDADQLAVTLHFRSASGMPGRPGCVQHPTRGRSEPEIVGQHPIGAVRGPAAPPVRGSRPVNIASTARRWRTRTDRMPLLPRARSILGCSSHPHMRSVWSRAICCK